MDPQHAGRLPARLSGGVSPVVLTHGPRPAGLAGPRHPGGDTEAEREGPGVGSQPQAPPPIPTPGSVVLPAAVGLASRSPGREDPTETPETSPVLCGR